MKKNKKRKFKFKGILIIITLVIIIAVVLFVCLKPKKNNTNNVVEVEVIDSIDNFDYQLNDNETKYFNDLFSSLKELLSKEDYNEEDYAVLIGQLFLVDFYDLDSKVMKSDVGGIQFVYEVYRTDFELGAMNSVYKFVDSNIYGDRKQKLPVVKKVEMTNLTKSSFVYNETTDSNAYFLDMKIIYENDLDYPVNVSLTLIHNNDKLEIAEMKTK